MVHYGVMMALNLPALAHQSEGDVDGGWNTLRPFAIDNAAANWLSDETVGKSER